MHFFFFSGREGICHKKFYYFVNLPPHALWMSVLSIAAYYFIVWPNHNLFSCFLIVYLVSKF